MLGQSSSCVRCRRSSRVVIVLCLWRNLSLCLWSRTNSEYARRLVEHLPFSFIYYCFDLNDPSQVNDKLCNRFFESFIVLLAYDKSQNKHVKFDEPLFKMIYIISATASYLKKLLQIKSISFISIWLFDTSSVQKLYHMNLRFFLLLAISMKNTTSKIFKKATHSRQSFCLFHLLSQFDQRTTLKIIKTIQKKARN